MKHNSMLLASVFMLLPVSAHAGDNAVPGANVQSGKPFDWNGFYMGAQLGAGNLATSNIDITGFWIEEGYDFKTSESGLLGGLRLGYDFTLENILVGGFVEGLIVSLNSREWYDTNVYEIGSKTKFLGSARAKIGVALGRLAVFASGGLSYANINHRFFDAASDDLINEGVSKMGYAFGLGTDYAINSSVSIGLDVSRYEFGKTTYDATMEGNDGWSFNDRVYLATVSVNYRF